LHGTDEGARAEVQQIARTLRDTGCAVEIGDERAALEAQRDTLDLLHVAAHGRFTRGGWARSGVELRDGWMGFESLRREALAGALIHFASCESGLSEQLPGSDIEGWITCGLGAGAAELVLSAWRLDDVASQAFSRTFYAAWAAGGSAGIAATSARGSVRQDHPHPFHWAAQIVVA
jgi:CHAT domain-containing protein